MDTFEAWIKVIQAATTLIGCGVAVWGINAWRRQLRGKREYELAEEALALMYDCRTRLRAIRNPLGYSGEGSTREKQPDETPEQTRALNLAFVAWERYEKRQDSFDRLYSIRYRFATLFGHEAASPIGEIQTALNRVLLAAKTLGGLWSRAGHSHSPGAEEQMFRMIQDQEAIFWGSGGSSDEIDSKVENAVKRLETQCSRILRPDPWCNRLFSSGCKWATCAWSWVRKLSPWRPKPKQ
jgi:hypothetical protein